MMPSPDIRLLAYYLPQFHPIPENDAWWGRGYTEWTTVRRARALFPGHYQPRLPSELGFYDLRDPSVREAQARLAAQYGVEGFCYWHYWLGGGRVMLDKPFTEVLSSGQPEFPFCLGWANHDWTAAIGGQPERILTRQTYPGYRDYVAQFYALLNAFRDPRYIEVEGKKMFIIFRPRQLPEPQKFVEIWSQLARREGLTGIYFVGIANHWLPEDYGFDASIEDQPSAMTYAFEKENAAQPKEKRNRPRVYEYARLTAYGASRPTRVNHFPTVMPGFDTTPRLGRAGVVFHNSSPQIFRTHCRTAFEQVRSRPQEDRFAFVKSWNEWGEGNYLEPDRVYGRAYLEVMSDELRRVFQTESRKAAHE